MKPIVVALLFTYCNGYVREIIFRCLGRTVVAQTVWSNAAAFMRNAGHDYICTGVSYAKAIFWRL